MLEDVKTIQQLIQTLHSMKDYVQKIFDIEEQKYEVIKNLDMELLIKYNEEESVLVQQIENIENQRLELVAKLSTTIGYEPTIPISQLATLLPKEYQQQVLDITGAIKAICTRLDVITERNEYILKSNSEILNQILDISQGTTQDQYNSQGLTTELKKQSLHMLDQLI